ncbi:MAG: flavoprotein [Alphaproteobacteria bacterium]
MNKKHIILIVTGSIAACKAPLLISGLKKENFNITCILTNGGKEFISALTLSSLSGNPTYEELFSLKDETEMGHIKLSREADLILVAPASCNIIAKITHGFADDLASSVLLASNKPIVIAPAMNSMMWENKATKRNIKQLLDDGIKIIGPAQGELACGEMGLGRMEEIDVIIQYVKSII